MEISESDKINTSIRDLKDYRDGLFNKRTLRRYLSINLGGLFMSIECFMAWNIISLFFGIYVGLNIFN